MGANDRADAILQWRDDAAAIGVVLGIRREDHANIQVEPNGVAADLNVAFFQHVEQTNLYLGGQVRQFVDGEDAAVGARDEAKVHGGFIGKITALGVFDEIDFANQISDGNVGSSELFVIARGAGESIRWGLRRLARRGSACRRWWWGRGGRR